MNDDELKIGIRAAYEAAEGTPPPFDEAWAAAEARAARPDRARWLAGVAAAALVAVVTMALWPAQQADLGDDYLIADALMNSTSWTAPSDVLLPDHQFDIYGTFDFPAPSTQLTEGTLL